jgi:hypothetical protein
MAISSEDNLSALRSQVAALTEREGTLIAEALTLSRSGGGRGQVDTLFAQAQSIQMERATVKKRIAQLLGTRRLHLGSEVWEPGVYHYTPAGGDGSVRVTVSMQPLGMYVAMPGGRTVRIETLDGSFDGPFGAEG